MTYTYTCSDCLHLYQRMKQQEETIAQLVEIIGAANRRIYDVDQRQLKMEHQLVREHQPRLAPSLSP
ncbi:hypothetical protein GCM10010954_33220 [Halobacillus andaensis]|uniref:Uncharacterized protein n=1 Tax=Halobacillus andaensis TaxID=1176239 RepID=A0A917BAI9_HALAA|nr:hypothetical protein [Halobacillus andaensis]MBP2005426.1 hypothetical protein [Halobacillus andaensis]GGF31368.1 hypothetical protein GCM10010954_33220 [Halobacillus andaensis]